MLRAREARSVSVLGRVSNGSHPRRTAFGQIARAPCRRMAQTSRLDLVDAPKPASGLLRERAGTPPVGAASRGARHSSRRTAIGPAFWTPTRGRRSPPDLPFTRAETLTASIHSISQLVWRMTLTVGSPGHLSSRGARSGRAQPVTHVGGFSEDRLGCRRNSVGWPFEWAFTLLCNQLADELSKRQDVAVSAGLFECAHIGLALLHWNDGPGVPACHQ